LSTPFHKFCDIDAGCDDILKPVVRLLLYSDAPILAAGLTDVLRGTDGFELTSVCSSLTELRSAAGAIEPHIVLMDFTSDMPADLLTQLDAGLMRRNVVLWVYEIAAETALHAMTRGVRGILRSTLEPELIIRCLQKVHEGELWFEKALVDDYMEARRAGLTGREVQLIRLLSQGLKNREIAATLSITEGTVKVYLSRLFQKLGVKDRFELALYGMKNPGSSALRFREAPPRRPRRGRNRLPFPDLD
jgi:two-component system, NarL family, nitrate/nitrite response regulator NarL